MPEKRFFLSSLTTADKTTELLGDEFKHLLVMRPSVGEKIELVDGLGHLAQAEILHIGKQKAELKIHFVDLQKPPPFELIIAQAIPRLNRLDVILEKGTELGMTQLWLFPGEAAEKNTISPTQHLRMQKVMIAALKQCGRLYLPKISPLPRVAIWKSMNYPLFFGDMRFSAPPFIKAWNHLNTSKGVIFVIGPEKGLTPEEIQHLEAIEGQGVSLNPHILRTDTAPLAALSIASHLLLLKN